eukprot:1856323-Rhodomonas_salina.2
MTTGSAPATTGTTSTTGAKCFGCTSYFCQYKQKSRICGVRQLSFSSLSLARAAMRMDPVELCSLNGHALPLASTYSLQFSCSSSLRPPILPLFLTYLVPREYGVSASVHVCDSSPFYALMLYCAAFLSPPSQLW